MENSLNTYSTASLAYLGDCVIELCVRERLVKKGLSSSARLNKAALEYVRASRQAEAMKNIISLLSEEENAVFHRGRNMGHSNTPKSATVAEYRAAIKAQPDLSVFTDDMSIMEAAGHTVKCVEGSYNNIKITTPEDIIIAENILNKTEQE